MEERNDGGTGAGEKSLLDGTGHWWWALGSGAQIMWGVRLIRRGYAGDNRLMPLKAFGVASLFIGSLATSSVALVRATGIHTVQDAIDLGANKERIWGLLLRYRISKSPRRMIYHEQIYRIHYETIME